MIRGEPVFDVFWSAYPRKVAKGYARKAWARITLEQKYAAMEALPKHCAAWADTESQYIPHPATWINGERWEDELAPRMVTRVAL